MSFTKDELKTEQIKAYGDLKAMSGIISSVDKAIAMIGRKRAYDAYDKYPDHFKSLVSRTNPLLAYFQELHDLNLQKFD